VVSASSDPASGAVPPSSRNLHPVLPHAPEARPASTGRGRPSSAVTQKSDANSTPHHKDTSHCCRCAHHNFMSYHTARYLIATTLNQFAKLIDSHIFPCMPLPGPRSARCCQQWPPVLHAHASRPRRHARANNIETRTHASPRSRSKQAVLDGCDSRRRLRDVLRWSLHSPPEA
jgi:hypothetical protein